MKYFLYTLLLISTTSLAQKIVVKGRLLDDTQKPLPSATVMLLNAKDSSLVNFSISNTEGYFELKNIARNAYFLKVSYVGLATFTKKVEAAENETIVEMGELKMEQETKQLNEIVVRGEKAPVVVKKDTIEFNAPSFKTAQNANVEDLLKKLPGVEVDNTGAIKAQGEDVQRVTVDGKEFFGRDPKLATKNLPAKAVDKVQIFDKKSDQATFTGIDDGQRDKTINLQLKEEYKNGYFGNSTLGGGTDDRYLGKLSLNQFRKNQQLSILAMGNNVNEQGFSIGDYMNFSGGSQQMMGGRGGGGMQITINGGGNQGGAQVNSGGRLNGIMNNYGGGVNFNRDFSKKTSLSSNYFYNQLNHNISQSTDRLSVFNNPATPDIQFTQQYNQTSRQLNNNYNHRVNLMLDHKIDSANSIKVTTTFANTQSDSDQTSEGATKEGNGDYLNTSSRSTYSSQVNNNLNTNALFRHRFAKKGRTFSTNVSYGVSMTDAEGSLDATNVFYKSGVVDRTQKQLQQNDQTTNNTSLGTTLSYTEPLGNRRYLEANYNFSQNQNKVNRRLFDIVNEAAVFNDALSVKYSSDYQFHRPGVNLKINREKFSITAGAGLQMSQLDGNFTIKSKDTTIARSYQNWVPSAHFNYDFTSMKRINIDYETSVQEPSITQLQPVYNNTDPLNITLGNPSLRPAFRHSVRSVFTVFNPTSFVNFFAFVNATYTRNAITNSVSNSVEGVRTSKPVNVDGNSAINASLSAGIPINSIGSRVNLSVGANQQFGTNVLNDVQTQIWQNGLSSTIRYNYRYKEIFDIDLTAGTSRNESRYESNPQNNQLYYNNNYGADFNLTILKNYQLTSDYQYLVYNSKTTGFNQPIQLWNVAISRSVFKDKSGEIKLGVNNLLNKNYGISQTASLNYVERTTANNLGRYIILSFTYALNKQLNPMQMRGPRGGGMRMMIRN